MNKLNCILLLSLAVQLQASSGTYKKTPLLQKSGYSWDEQFIESIEDGENNVRAYIAQGASLTVIDPLTKRTPLELAVIAGNNAAVETILDIARETQQNLAIMMTLDLTEKLNNVEASVAILLSSVKDDQR